MVNFGAMGFARSAGHPHRRGRRQSS